MEAFPFMATPLQNKTALVTGGGRGIGRGIALALAQLGADVALTARTKSEIDAVADEIRAHGVRALAVPADVSEHANITRVVGATADELGPVDVLVNNAGVIGPMNIVEETEAEAWAFVQAVNVVAPYGFIREVLPGMKARGYGRIINISSGAGRDRGKLRWSAYSVSKAAVNMLTRNVSMEIDGTGVTINSVYPGVVNTAMIEHIRSQPADEVGPIQDRFHQMAADDTLTDPETVGWQVAAVALTAHNGEVLDVRVVGDELAKTLAEHDASPVVNGR